MGNTPDAWREPGRPLPESSPPHPGAEHSAAHLAAGSLDAAAIQADLPAKGAAPVMRLNKATFDGSTSTGSLATSAAGGYGDEARKREGDDVKRDDSASADTPEHDRLPNARVSVSRPEPGPRSSVHERLHAVTSSLIECAFPSPSAKATARSRSAGGQENAGTRSHTTSRETAQGKGSQLTSRRKRYGCQCVDPVIFVKEPCLINCVTPM